MNGWRFLALGLAACAPACVGLAGPAEAAASAYNLRIAPLLESYCTDCHGPEKQKAKVNLAGARTAEELAAGSDLWFRVLDQLEGGKMPPKDEEQPRPEERDALAGFVRGELSQLLLAKQRTEGRSKFRRLTRTEYANTVEDLFGIRPRVDLNLPTDGLVDGYDKVSAALPLSAEGAMGYLQMAEEMTKWMFRPIPPPKNPLASSELNRTIHAKAMESDQSKGNLLVLEDAVVSFNSDNSSGRIDLAGVQIPGKHTIRVSVYAYQTDQPLPFGLFVGNTQSYPQQLELAVVGEAPPGKPKILEIEVYLKAGDSMRPIPFGLGVPVPKNSMASDCHAPGLALQWVDIVTPALPLLGERFLTADFPPVLVEEIRKTLPTKSKTTTWEAYRGIVEKTFERVGARLYRRDLKESEIAALTEETMRQIEGGEQMGKAFLSQIVELMTAPDFLCVVETPGRLSDFALASRLAYFLWNSTPDEQLLDLARRGKLHDSKVLFAETERLLKDPKSDRFINDFADQWLNLRAIADTSPDHTLYPAYDELLRFSSVRETRGYLRALIAENLSVRRLVSSPWAILNQPLAEHYGIPGVTGVQTRKVDLPGTTPYGGLWTQSAIMKVTANGTNTSPVKRGVWVSERLLGIHIPPPPPNVMPVEPDTRGAKTLREQLAMHSVNKSCAACHARFDPYGFALESFDVTGGYRTKFREVDPEFAKLSTAQQKERPSWRDGLPVDCKGKTPDGQEFADISELRHLLARNPKQLALGYMRHLITYATGAPPTPVDQPAIEAMVQQTAEKDYPMRSLIHSLVQSEMFRSK